MRAQTRAFKQFKLMRASGSKYIGEFLYRVTYDLERKSKKEKIKRKNRPKT